MADFNIVTELFIDGTWQNISADVRDRDECVIDRGISDESNIVRPGSLTFTLQNGRSNVAGNIVGRYSPRNPASDLFGKIGRNTPVRQSIEGLQRFQGEISEWPVRWGLAGETDVWVRIKAYGILRRLGQGGGKPAQSAIKRKLTQLTASAAPTAPVAYWPLDAGEDSLTGELLLGSGPGPFELASSTTPYFEFGHAELAPWLGTGLRIQPDGTSAGQNITTFRGANVGMPQPVTNEWECSWHFKYDRASRISGTGANSAQTRMVLAGPPGPAQQVWTVQTDNFGNGGFGPGFTVTLVVGGVQEYTHSSFGFGDPAKDPCDGNVHHMIFRAGDFGATSIGHDLRMDGTIVDSFQDNSAPATLQGVDSIEFRNVAGSVSAGTADSPAVTIGNVALRHGLSNGNPSIVSAGLGHNGEPAGRRIERLCLEEGIPFGFELPKPSPPVPGGVITLDSTEILGQQQIAPVLTLFDHAATADGGILYESRDSVPVQILVGSDGTFTGTIVPWVTPLAANTLTLSANRLSMERTTSVGPFEVYSNATGAVARTPVQPGVAYSASISKAVSFKADFTATADGRCRIEWFDAANTSLGFADGPLTPIADAADTYVSVTAVAPGGAVTARVGYATGNVAVGDFNTIDDVKFVRGIDPPGTKQAGAGGLVYATLRSLYNNEQNGKPGPLVLDYQAGHISAPFDPIEDDQNLVNDATATRFAGGERRFVKTAGALSTAAPPAGVGRYDRSWTVNTRTDDRLLQHAAMRVAFGTFDEARFPEVGFRVIKWPELLNDYARIDSGSWIEIRNPPPWLPPEPIGIMVTGYVERYSRADWSCKWWTVPSGLYRIGLLAVDRLDSDVCTTAAGPMNAGIDTSLYVTFDSPVRLAGAASFVTTPNHASFAVTDLDFKIDLALDTWKPAATTEIAGRQLLTGNQRSWLLHQGTDGSIRLRWSTDGTVETDTIFTPFPVLPAAGSRLALWVQFDVNNGAGGRTTTLFTAPTISGPWTLYQAITVGVTATIFASTAPLDIGDVQTSGFAAMVGKVYAAELLASIGGAAVANPDFTKLPHDATSFTDAAGKVWTLSGAPILRRESAATGAADYNVRTAGTVLHVTQVDDVIGAQKFTVDAVPVNGVRKPIPPRSPVSLDKPWRLTL